MDRDLEQIEKYEKEFFDTYQAIMEVDDNETRRLLGNKLGNLAVVISLLKEHYRLSLNLEALKA